MTDGTAFFERLRAQLKKEPPKSMASGGMVLKEAAVLAPVFWRGGEPWVYLTMRPLTMRKHAGQISFPVVGAPAFARYCGQRNHPGRANFV